MTTRQAEFGAGHDSARPDIAPGTQTQYYVNQRYGTAKQLPFRGPRRAGPLPFPETLDTHLRSEEDRRWSHGE